jgi:hypothetical protein
MINDLLKTIRSTSMIVVTNKWKILDTNAYSRKIKETLKIYTCSKKYILSSLVLNQLKKLQSLTHHN